MTNPRLSDPSRAPNLRVALQRVVGGAVLETTALARQAAQVLRGRSHPQQRFIIFGRGRSGSTLLVSLLDRHPQITCAGEVMRYRTFAPSAYIQRVLATGNAPVTGCKLLSYQMRSIHGMPPDTGFLRDLANQGIAIIYLHRENPVRHAISNIMARRQRIYHVTQAVRQERDKIIVEPAEILRWMRGSEALGVYERAVLQDVPHLPLTYERDLEPISARQDTLDKIMTRFNLPPLTAQSDLRKVTPENLADIIENHDALFAALHEAGYARYLAPAQEPSP